MSAKEDSGITQLQRKFINEYIIDFNAEHAAIRAGYAQKSARMQASRMLTKDNIQAAIAKALQERSKRLEITQDRVVLEIARLALSDPRSAVDENGSIKPIHEWSDDLAGSIASIKVLEMKDADGTVIGQTKEVKFWDKNKAQDNLMKHLGGYEIDNKQKSPLQDLSREALLLIREKLTNARQQ